MDLVGRQEVSWMCGCGVSRKPTLDKYNIASLPWGSRVSEVRPIQEGMGYCHKLDKENTLSPVGAVLGDAMSGGTSGWAGTRSISQQEQGDCSLKPLPALQLVTTLKRPQG